MVPTVLDLLDIEPPQAIRGVTQAPLHGVSFARTLDDAAAETSHHTQYFEMLGHRAIYYDGWRAVCPWPGPSFTGNAEAPVTNPFVLNPGALTWGANPGSAVTDDYASPFKFTGTIHSVTVDVSGKLIDDPEAELRAHMARQ